MQRHGKSVACCGSGAICGFPDSCAKVWDQRLAEAVASGAKRIVTVCHYCNQTFATTHTEHDIQVVTYVSLIALAMVREREAKYLKWYTCANLGVCPSNIHYQIE